MRTLLSRVALIVALLVVPPAGAFADDRPDGPPPGIQTTDATLAGVLAMQVKARGKDLDAYASRIEEWAYRDGTFAGFERTVWAGQDYKTSWAVGPVVTREGRRGGVRWRQNVNGLSVIVSGVHREEDAFDEAMTAAEHGGPGNAVKLLGEVTAPVAAYVISVNPTGGRPTWIFVDKSSGQIVRKEEFIERYRRITTYSNFSDVAESVLPHTVTYSYGTLGSDRSVELKGMKVDVPVKASDLDIEPDKRKLVEFPAGATSVPVPAHIYHDAAEIVVRVTINGRGLDLILDSGAGGIFLDKDVVEQLGLQQYGGIEGQAGRWALVSEMSIGDLKMKNIFVRSLRFAGRPQETTKAVGLIGFDFLASIGLKVDFDHSALTAYPPGTIQSPAVGGPLPIRFDDFVPLISVAVGNSPSSRFIFDTGAAEVIVFPDFVRAHPDDMRDQGLGHEENIFIPDFYFGTVGGVTKGHATQVKRFVFGVPFNEFIVFQLEPDSFFQFEDIDGLIGYHFWRFFNLYFDYDNSRIMLEPNNAFRAMRKVP